MIIIVVGIHCSWQCHVTQRYYWSVFYWDIKDIKRWPFGFDWHLGRSFVIIVAKIKYVILCLFVCVRMFFLANRCSTNQCFCKRMYACKRHAKTSQGFFHFKKRVDAAKEFAALFYVCIKENLEPTHWSVRGLSPCTLLRICDVPGRGQDSGSINVRCYQTMIPIATSLCVAKTEGAIGVFSPWRLGHFK